MLYRQEADAQSPGIEHEPSVNKTPAGPEKAPVTHRVSHEHSEQGLNPQKLGIAVTVTGRGSAPPRTIKSPATASHSMATAWAKAWSLVGAN